MLIWFSLLTQTLTILSNHTPSAAPPSVAELRASFLIASTAAPDGASVVAAVEVSPAALVAVVLLAVHVLVGCFFSRYLLLAGLPHCYCCLKIKRRTYGNCYGERIERQKQGRQN
ncbi:hypothetical protein ACP275_09G039000 [Erythranthe tilingii]